MLTQIVVLFMATQLNMPTWCKTFVLIAIGLNVLRFLYGLYKTGEKQGEQDAKS